MTDYADLFRQSYSTSLLADSAFRTGIALGLPAPGLHPLDRASKLAGPAVTVNAQTDLVSILDAVHQAEPGDVVVISNQSVPAALMGDLIGTEAVRKGLAGFVVDGLVRDTVALTAMGLPVFCRGSHPAGPLKVSAELRGIGEVGGDISVGGATVSPGMWIFGDADGVIILGENGLDQIVEAAEAARQQEEALAQEIASGTALGEAFELDEFLSQRRSDPKANFNAHLTRINRAI